MRGAVRAGVHSAASVRERGAIPAEDGNGRPFADARGAVNAFYVRAAGRLAAVSRIAFSTEDGTCEKVNGSME